jgi:hypothetical protein
MATDWNALGWPPAELCAVIESIEGLDDICFPGGFCLSHVWDGVNKIPHLADMPLDFFSQIGPALAPLKPLFDVLDTALAIFRCVKAVPDAITNLDPSELFQCIPDLAKLIDKLLSMIPQLSVPKLIRAVIRNLAKLLRAIAADLRYLQSQLQRIADMIDRAAQLNDVKLTGFLSCAQNTIEQQTMSTAEALKGIGRLVLLINIFIAMIGGEELPCFGSLMSDNLADGFDAVIDLLTALATVLDEIAAAIPDPDYLLTLALGDQRC